MCLKYYMHTYKKIFIIYIKFKHNSSFWILSDNLTQEICIQHYIYIFLSKMLPPQYDFYYTENYIIFFNFINPSRSLKLATTYKCVHMF